MDAAPHAVDATAARLRSSWAVILLAALATVAALWLGRDFLIPIAMAATVSVLLWPAVRTLDRWFRLRPLSALVAVLATLAVTGLLAMSVGTKLTSAVDQLPSALRLAARDISSLNTDGGRAMQRTRSALSELDRSVARATGTPADRPAAPAPGAPAAPAQRSIVAQLVDGVTALAIAASKSAAGVLLEVGMIALLSFFMLCSAEALGDKLIAWCRAGTAGGDRPGRCEPMLDGAAYQIRMFAGVTVVTNIAIGFGVGLIFELFGVPDAWMWGLVAAALHFLPYAGLGLVMLLAALEVYVVQASLLIALGAAVSVMLVGIVIGTAMAVWLQGRVARIDSATLFAGTIFWSIVWGGWGLVLGPLLVVVARLVWQEAPLLRGQPARPLPAEAEEGELIQEKPDGAVSVQGL
ncbi:AI-2E family transporter [Pelomonas sp. KK5]|uniref:AI-2E family transporter n=1 Tax=Pelomonas sp. KK5 TaxID=1855730 RepID=UPI00097CB542|nr:AI-2E family transporter [Pelomonas sp. KK5]